MPAKKTPAKPAKSAKAASSASRKAQARSTAKRPVPKPVKPSTPARKPSVKAEPVKAEPAKASRPAAAKANSGDKPAPRPPTPEPKVPQSGGAVDPQAPASQRSPDMGPIATFVQRNPKPAPVVVDDDGEDSSLLAGPRNVQPYIVKRGEQYMNREQLDHFRTILASWKRDLMEEVDRTVSHMKDEAANFPDPNDRATQESEFSLELRTRDRERKLIKKIDDSLQNLERGDYGFCETCGIEIGIRRLEARPTATQCIDCKTLDELRERQVG